MVRLRHATSIEAAVGEEVPEIVLINSHDGSSSYQLLAGFFRTDAPPCPIDNRELQEYVNALRRRIEVQHDLLMASLVQDIEPSAEPRVPVTAARSPRD